MATSSPSDRFPLQRIRVRERTLAVRDSAPERTDLPIVLGVHGIPESSAVWQDLMAELEGEARVVVLDLPGFGASDKPRDLDLSLPSLAGWLGDAVDVHLGVEAQVHLVVHDIGGPIGLIWAQAHAERLASLTVLNTTLFVEHFKPPLPAVLAAIPVVGRRTVATILGSASRFESTVQRAAGRPLDAATLAALRAPYERADARWAAAGVWAAYPRSTGGLRAARRGLRAMDVPARVVFGARDPYCLPASARAFAERLPQATLHLLDDVGHWTATEAPVEVAGHVRALVRG
ncbi:alpha/beta hydrolase [Nocardioides sp. TRM66260-LWL]|uniref:alpha/beta fold hydrolase n=1 Tax=Nocardioides sp. TRM66260-LWL TaxID=2874478 RepID=UPI001CC55738|nr:alpha/beta hydrolase [Nocardioides sp. TRM66260-LWL]MBZ5735753.1 alpha/beta hydrolase [Nocardioides sp. TRM66260-LWL]